MRYGRPVLVVKSLQVPIPGVSRGLFYKYQATHGYRQEHLWQHHRQALDVVYHQVTREGLPVSHLGGDGAVHRGALGQTVQQDAGGGGGGQGEGRKTWRKGAGGDEILDGT